MGTEIVVYIVTTVVISGIGGFLASRVMKQNDLMIRLDLQIHQMREELKRNWKAQAKQADEAARLQRQLRNARRRIERLELEQWGKVNDQTQSQPSIEPLHDTDRIDADERRREEN